MSGPWSGKSAKKLFSSQIAKPGEKSTQPSVTHDSSSMSGEIHQELTVSESNLPKKVQSDLSSPTNADRMDNVTLEECRIRVSAFLGSIYSETDHPSIHNSKRIDLNGANLPHLERMGMLNEGNQCYQNCVVQCLLSFPPFMSILSTIHSLYSSSSSSSPPSSLLPPLYDDMYPLLTQFIKIIQQMKEMSTPMKLPANSGMSIVKPRQCILMTEFRDVVSSMNGLFSYEQHDVQEFLMWLIDALSSELDSLYKMLLDTSEDTQSLDNNPSAHLTHPPTHEMDEWMEIGTKGKEIRINESKMQQSFLNPFFEIRLRIRSQKHSSNVREQVERQSFVSLAVSISPNGIYSVNHALNHFFNLDNTKDRRSYYVEHSPACLIIHLLRFQYDRKLQMPVKIQKCIRFPTELSLEPYLFRGVNDCCVRYSLFAVMEHIGDSVSSGHYIAYTRSLTHQNMWMKFDDSVVTTINTPSLLQVEPFLLLYQCCGR